MLKSQFAKEVFLKENLNGVLSSSSSSLSLSFSSIVFGLDMNVVVGIKL